MDLDMNLYPTIAISDGVNAACCWAASVEAFNRGRPEIAFGIGAVALASSIGTLRFGFAPKMFAWWNCVTADFAGTAGVPLIGLGFARARGVLPELLEASRPGLPLRLLGTLTVAGFLSKKLSPQFQELYLVFLNVLSMGCLLYSENFLENKIACAAVAMFILAGVGVGSDRHKYINFGVIKVRCENVFHYLLGTSMLLFAQAIPVNK